MTNLKGTVLKSMRSRSLRTKLAVYLVAAVSAFLALDFGLRRATFRESIASFEKTRAFAAAEQLDRSIEVIAASRSMSAESLGSVTDISEQQLERLGADIAVTVADDGRVLKYSVAPGAFETTALRRAFPSEVWHPNHPILRIRSVDAREPRGLLTVGGAVLVFGSAMISVDGQPALTVVGEKIDDETLAAIRQMTGFEIEVFLDSMNGLDDTNKEVIEQATSLQRPIVKVASSGAMAVYGPLIDLAGKSIGAFRLDVPMAHASLWSLIEEFEFQTALGIFLLFPLALLVLLQIVVTGPLARLTAHVTTIGRSDDVTLRLNSSRQDEIGVLAKEFDGMLAKLEQSHLHQRRHARFAGRSEVAVDVAHNAGNLLNSVTVSTSLAKQRLDSIEIADLRTIQSELAARQGRLDEYCEHHPQGRHILQFFEASLHEIESQLTEARGEVEALGGLVDNVSSILQTLSNVQSEEGLTETVVLSELLDRATQTCLRSYGGGGVHVEIDCDPTLVISIDRQKLLEVIVAVVENAIEAMHDVPEADRILELTVKGTESSLNIEIQDAGRGPSDVAVEQMFQPGVSSKPGASGLGLHKASLAVASMKGQITAETSDACSGMTVTIRLPLAGDDAPGIAA